MGRVRFSGRADWSAREAVDRPTQSFLETDSGLKAHQLACAGDVEVARRLPIRFGVVPNDLALEAGELADQLAEVADLRLATGADIHRFRTLKALGRKQQGPRGVVDIEELASRLACAPEHDLGRSLLPGLHEL